LGVVTKRALEEAKNHAIPASSQCPKSFFSLGSRNLPAPCASDEVSELISEPAIFLHRGYSDF
jgi:hypothetical protein